MYSVDALTVKSLGMINTGFRGVVTASTSVLVQDKDYTITFPITLSAHAVANIMINNSPTSSQDFVSPTYSGPRGYKYPGEPIVNPNFEQNWVMIGTVAANSLTAVVTNIPTRFLRLEGHTFSGSNSYAFVWTQKMATGY